MNSRRRKQLVWTVMLGAITAFIGAVIKMLVTDQWPNLRPLVATGWDRTLAAFTWLDQTIALPHWVVISVPLMMLFLMAILVWSLNSTGAKLTDAEEAIAGLKTPSVPPLNNHQEIVLAAIAAYDTADNGCDVRTLPPGSGLTLLQVNGAVDVLEQRKLVSFYYASSGKFVSLSPAGRAHVLAPDYSPPILPSASTVPVAKRR
ncbi:hypothetical protein [Pseudomonas sp. G3-19]